MDPNSNILFYDFYAYYAASKLAQQNQDFYSPQALWTVLSTLGNTEANLNLIPPWSIWIIYWLAFLPFSLACFIWLCLGILTTCFVTIQSRTFLQFIFREKVERRFLFVFSLCFFPLLKSLAYGQSVFIALFGLSISCILYERQQKIWAGIAFSLCFIKPQLFLLASLVLCLRDIHAKKLHFLIGIFLGFMFQASLSVLLVPTAYQSLFANLSDSVSLMKAYAMPSLLRISLGWLNGTWMLLLHAILSLLAALYFRKDDVFKDFWMLIIPLSIFASPYAWSHDFLFLIYPAIFLSYYYWRIQRVFALVGMFFFFISCMVLIAQPGFEQWIVFLMLPLFYWAIRMYRSLLHGSDAV